MRQRLNLRQQIILGATVLVFLVLATGAMGLWYARTSADTLEDTRVSVERLNRLAQVESAWNDVLATVDKLVMTRQATLVEEELESRRVAFNEALYAVPRQRFGISLEIVAANRQLVGDIQFFGAEFNTVVDQIERAARERRWAEAQVLRHTELATLQRQFEDGLEALKSNAGQELEGVMAQSAARQRATRILVMSGLAFAIVLGVGFALVGARNIVEPLNHLVDRARQIRDGDFTPVAPLERQDEIGALSSSLSVMTEWLTDSYKVLEERVDERTRDLQLAADVGRRLGRVRDLDTLLQEAVELIRQRFDLYYTQVYLTGNEGQTLELRAGTGSVGRELRRRGFKLPIDLESINGSAAHERRAMVITDTEHSRRFRPNPLLPDTRSEIAMPLLVGDRVVGVLDLQSDQRYGLTDESLAAFEVLAGQLAIAIENAHLFAANRAARAALEGQAQQRVEESWQRFLNAVDRPERLAYSYAGGAVHADPDAEMIAEGSEGALSTEIELNQVPIGEIRLKAQPQQRWTAQDVEIVEEVAGLVAQQVENLRLLAEAERYREEAERALRRLTQESWQEVAANVGAFHYDGRQVKPLHGGDLDYSLAQPLLVRGEPVGELLVDGKGGPADEEARELVSAVAARLSTHLEQLRLSQQTERALADVQRRSQEMANLNRVVTNISATLDLRNSLQIVVDELVTLTTADQARIGLLDEDGTQLTIVSEQFDESRSPSALGLTIPVEGNALTQEVLSTAKPVVVQNAQTHRMTAPIREMLREQGIQTMVVLPILSGNEIIGTVGMDILTEGVDFDTDDLRLAETVVFQAATAIENARLFDQIQETLAETRALYRASAELNRAQNYDDLLDVLRQHTVAGDGSTTLSLALFDTPWTDSVTPQWIDILAYWSAEPVQEPTLRFSLEDYPALEILERERYVSIRDVADDPRLDPRSRRALLRGFEARAVLSVPLVAGGQWIGHVSALYPEPREFDEGELQQLLNLAGQAAIAVQSINLLEETSRLLESEQRQRRISDTLVRAASRMLGVMDEEALRGLVVEEIENLLSPDQITLYVWRAETDTLEIERHKHLRGEKHQSYVEGQMLSAGERPQLWRVLRRGEAELEHLPSDDDFVHEHYVVPWQVGNDVAGVIELYHTARGATIREEDQASVEGIVQQAAIRLQSARLFEEAKLRTAETEALYRASRRINMAATYGEILEAVREHTMLGSNALGLSLAFFDKAWTGDDVPEQIEVLARWNRTPGLAQRSRYTLEEVDGLVKLLSPDSVVVINGRNGQGGGDAGSRALLQVAEEANSVLFVPLRVGGQWRGFIEAAYAEGVDLTESEERRLVALASQAAAAAQGLHLLRQTQLRAQRERVLREITARVRGATDVDVIMKTAVREVSRALGRDAFVMLGETPGKDENGSSGNRQNGGQAE